MCLVIRYLTLALFLTTLSVAPRLAQSQTDDTAILYYEPVVLRFAYPDTDSTETQDSDSASYATLSFSAFGRQFDAELRHNAMLTRRLPPERRRDLADIRIWEGGLTGLSGSWIRITTQGDYASGAFWDGESLYNIEPYESALPHLVAPDPSHAGGTIVYQSMLPLIPAGDVVVDTHPDTDTAIADPGASGPLPAFKPALQQGLELDLGVVGDAEFGGRYRTSAQAQALSQINVADAIFVQQLGVHLRVAELQIFTPETDPFSSTDPFTLLRQLEGFKAWTPEFAALGLVHLLTGKTLDRVDSRNIIGVANTGTVCSTRYGAALSAEGYVVAHEIAHNLGAPHDAEAGSPCESSPRGHVMDPEMLSSFNIFSACSIEQMRNRLAMAGCLSPLPASDLVVTVSQAPAEVSGNSPFAVSFELAAAGTEDLLAVEVELEALGGVTVTGIEAAWPYRQSVNCSWDQSPMLCTTHRIERNRSLQLRLSLEATQLGEIVIDADAWALNDSDPANNRASVSVDVLPAIRLDVERFSVSPEVAIPGEIVQLATTIANNGLVGATDVQIRIDTIPEFFEFSHASLTNGGACAAQSDSTTWLCPVGALDVGQQADVAFELRALHPGTIGNIVSTGDFSISLLAAEPDVGQGAATAKLSVNSAVADAVLTISGPSSPVQNGRARFEITIENLGPDPIDEATVVYSHEGLEWGSRIGLEWGPGCFRTGEWEARCTRRRMNLAAGQSRTMILATGPALIEGSYIAEATVHLRASDPTPNNNTASLAWSVVAPPTQTTSQPSSAGGSGGGGAMTLPWLLLLAAQWYWQSRRRKLDAVRSRPLIAQADPDNEVRAC
jgi:uncharacterized repeat protein (TIGR01451 family)